MKKLSKNKIAKNTCSVTNKPLITTRKEFWDLYRNGDTFSKYSLYELDLSGCNFRWYVV